jgi:hypothetical protein
VRYDNLAPGPDAGNTYVVFKGAIGASPPLATDIAVGLPTPFSAATAGANTFTILKLPGHVVVVEGSAGTLDLQPGSVNTVAIIQNASGGFELLDIRSCS